MCTTDPCDPKDSLRPLSASSSSSQSHQSWQHSVEQQQRRPAADAQQKYVRRSRPFKSARRLFPDADCAAVTSAWLEQLEQQVRASLVALKIPTTTFLDKKTDLLSPCCRSVRRPLSSSSLANNSVPAMEDTLAHGAAAATSSSRFKWMHRSSNVRAAADAVVGWRAAVVNNSWYCLLDPGPEQTRTLR
jgi:hypothetical protein